MIFCIDAEGNAMSSRSPFCRSLSFAVALAATVVVITPSPTRAASEDPVLVKVDGIAIKESDLVFAAQSLGRKLENYTTPAFRDYLVSYLMDTILLGQVAQSKGLDTDPQVKRRLDLVRRQVLSEQLLEVTGQSAATEDAIRKAYDEAMKKAGPPPQEYRLRAIFFKIDNPEDEANVKAAREHAEAALRRLEKGEDFAAVVAATTDHEGTKESGGDLGYVTAGILGSELAEVATKLPPGQISSIIRTAAGFHILKVEDSRPRKPADLETVRSVYAQTIAKKAQSELLEKLRATAKIEWIGAQPPVPGPKKLIKPPSPPAEPKK
ncbi:MAG: peptidylprolyl isomerase [Candidatus Competibacteraceae bacterium]|nr:peptidylprolyl isomerase [Candidatus Competibacteraceae bacterium]